MYIEIFSDNKRDYFFIGNCCNDLKNKIKSSRDFLFNYFNLKDRKFYFIELENRMDMELIDVSDARLFFKVSPNHMITIKGNILMNNNKLIEFKRDPYDEIEDLDDNISGSIELDDESFIIDNGAIVSITDKKFVSIEKDSVIIDKDREEAQCKFIQNIERRRNDK